MITRYPKHPSLSDALFYMGQCHEKNGNKDLAITFYKRVDAMGDETDEGIKTRVSRALAELGA
jgi:TolA-binding protein